MSPQSREIPAVAMRREVFSLRLCASAAKIPALEQRSVNERTPFVEHEPHSRHCGRAQALAVRKPLYFSGRKLFSNFTERTYNSG